EYYFSITMDNDAAGLVMIASSAGGMEIEDTAANDPDAIIRVPISLTLGYQDYQGRELARKLGLPRELWKEFISLAGNAVKLFIQKDCSLVEMNPLVETDEGHLLALDAKITFDDNAIYRHKDCAELFDPLEEDPKEVQAKKFDLSYISLNGDVGCLVNGAGLAMATMDVIIKFGGMPANFLDVGGSASKEKVKAAFEILLADGNVHAIFVNIFGGIMKCDVIAEGVVAAARDIDIKVPLVVRLEGTNVDRGKQILKDSGLNIIAASDMADGARKAVSSAAAFAKEAEK
ncbi:MAG: ADP-forming succinate--CoA ligase subunit beta, partial [Clostridiales bacterium]|nr:ADP-forming succinate--CoA ligase subunit beta [Clostridiales bacterium]